MPQHIYTVEIDGKQYDLEGDHPPTEAEARAAIGSPSTPEPQQPNVFQQDLGTSIGQAAIGGLKELGNLGIGVLHMATQSPIKTLSEATEARRALLKKAETAPTVSERFAYNVTGRIPFLGPAIAQVGEQIGTGDPETMGRGLMNGAVLAQGLPSVRAAEGAALRSAVPAAVQTARSAADATGATIRTVASHPATQTAAGAAYGYAHGGIPGAVIGAIAPEVGGSALTRLLRAIRNTDTPAATSAPTPKTASDPLPSSAGPSPLQSDALRAEVMRRLQHFDYRTTDAVPIDAIKRDVINGGSIIESGESIPGLQQRIADLLKKPTKSQMEEAQRLAKAVRQRQHITAKSTPGTTR
jgi:hypothetical protein